jgi:hypothetical protein
LRHEWQKNLECPITYEVMHAPVRLSDGHDYSLGGARDLVGLHGRSPHTDQAMMLKAVRDVGVITEAAVLCEAVLLVIQVAPL